MRLDVSAPQDAEGFVAGIMGALDLGRQRLAQAVAGLTPEQLEFVPAGLANSAATLVVHVCATELAIGSLISGQALSDDLRSNYLLDQPRSPLPAARGETQDSLSRRMEESRRQLLQHLSTLNQTDLDREVAFSQGRQPTVRWLLALLANHQALHLGHIQMIKRLLQPSS